MGRVKLKIKKLESTSNRQVTYSKRRNGILKKAKELSILCDIDILLLLFSPTGKPTLFRGERSSIEDVIAKFVQLTPQERAKRKLESLEALKKTFKKLDHDVNMQDFLGTSSQSVEELANQVTALQSQLTDVHRRLSCWSNPDKIENIEYLRHMEGSLKESLHHIRIRKETLGKYQLMPLECTSQFQAGMHLPLMMSGMQEAQPLSWLSNSENQHMIPLEPNFLPQRDVECSNDALSTYSAYLASGKLEVGNTGHLDNTEQEVNDLSGLRSNDCLSLQLNEHFPYYAYNGLNFPEAKKLKPEMEMNLQGNCLDYQTNRTFEMPRQTFDNVHHTWVSSSNPCAIAMFNEDSYQQQPH